MKKATPATRVHGGPDLLGAAAHDFSTNANAAGPCQPALAAVQAADAARYPEPSYQALRERLARLHDVAPARIVIGASASELIFRLTAATVRRGGTTVWIPPHAYGDYASAARAWKMSLCTLPSQAALRWCCEPSNPLGQPQAQVEAARAADGTWILDRAYEPLRLRGSPRSPAVVRQVWQLWSPNKALGLTGVRGAYVIAPVGRTGEALELEELCPSWPLGAHGLAMLQAWCDPAVQLWLERSREQLRAWKAQLLALCASLGWQVVEGEANFLCARPRCSDLDHMLAALRAAGVKLRDCTSFGLPGWVRLAALPPASQAALASAWTPAVQRQHPTSPST